MLRIFQVDPTLVSRKRRRKCRDVFRIRFHRILRFQVAYGQYDAGNILCSLRSPVGWRDPDCPTFSLAIIRGPRRTTQGDSGGLNDYSVRERIQLLNKR